MTDVRYNTQGRAVGYDRTAEWAGNELLHRALPLLVRLGDFIGNGERDPERPDSLGQRCDLILDIKRHLGTDE